MSICKLFMNNKMETKIEFDDIVEFLFPEYIGIGTLMRLRRTNLNTYRAINSNFTGWFSFFKQVKMKWVKSYKEHFDDNKTMWYIHNNKAIRKKSFSSMVIQNLLPLNKRCRECGHTNGLKTLNFYVCSNCADDDGGYSELVSSKEVREIITNVGNGWKRKLPANFSAYNPPLRIIRRTTPYQKRLYWAHDAMILKKKYEERRKNVEHKSETIK